MPPTMAPRRSPFTKLKYSGRIVLRAMPTVIDVARKLTMAMLKALAAFPSRC